MANGAELLVEGLYEQGVRHVFGMPGSHSVAIYDAIHRQGKIKTVLTRNEQAGAFAADGYARVTGQPGVVCTTAGPGATNALSGIAEAWSDGVPLLLVTGQVNSDRMHLECGNYHEIDLESLFRPITKYCGVARIVDDIPRMVQTAFAVMSSGRRRPAALVLPQDLLSKESGGDTLLPRAAEPAKRGVSGLPEISRDAIVNAAKLLADAERPVILAGGGALWANAAAEVRDFAQHLKCPVITTLNGKGLLDERDPRSLGMSRGIRALTALHAADAMLAVGCRFTEVSTGLRRMPVPKNLVQIDLDPQQIGMNHPVAVGIVADAKAALTELSRILPKDIKSHWGERWDKARAAKPAKPEWLVETLREELPENARVFTDACEMALRLQEDFPAYAPRTFFYPSTYIALGWGFPAAVGGAVAMPDVPVACVSGDGGFLMTAQELATAVRYKLRVIAIVHNDSTYGSIKIRQQRQYQGRYLDVDLNNPDLVQFATSFGVPAARATSATELSAALRGALNRDGPTLIEVPDQWRSLRG